jgi:hypothetical protein
MLRENQLAGRRMSLILKSGARGALAAVALAMAPGAALAATDYWFLGAGADVYDFVDVSTIATGSDGGTQAWTTRVLERKSDGKKIKTVLTFATFFCGRDAFQVLKTVQYRGNGAMKSNLDGPMRSERVIPGTVGAEEYAFVCADPFDRADKARDLGDIDPIKAADSLAREAELKDRHRRW